VFGVCLVSLPIQIAGTEVKDFEAICTQKVTGQSQLYVQIRLVELKIARGIRSPEKFKVSDFRRLVRGEPDQAIDFSAYPTFQYLDQWWSIYLANRLRH
jgi:hypothetical protein